jgi:hypothetical protein
VRKEIGVVTRWPMLCLSSRVYSFLANTPPSIDGLCVKGNEPARRKIPYLNK